MSRFKYEELSQPAARSPQSYFIIPARGWLKVTWARSRLQFLVMYRGFVAGRPAISKVSSLPLQLNPYFVLSAACMEHSLLGLP